MLSVGEGPPHQVAPQAPVGTVYRDATTSGVYVKTTSNGASGWTALDIIDGEEVEIPTAESVSVETQYEQDVAAIRQILRRKKALDELKAGKTAEQHRDNIASIRETRDFRRFGDAHAKIPDLYSMTPPEPPPGVPDAEIENYGPDGKLYKMGV